MKKQRGFIDGLGIIIVLGMIGLLLLILSAVETSARKANACFLITEKKQTTKNDTSEFFVAADDRPPVIIPQSAWDRTNVGDVYCYGHIYSKITD
jgi:hypothetical protein